MIKIYFIRPLIILFLFLLYEPAYAQQWVEGTTSLNYQNTEKDGLVSVTGIDTIYFNYEGQIHRSLNGGSSWSTLSIPNSHFDYSEFVNYHDGIASTYSSGQLDTVLITTDAGANWTPILIGNQLSNFKIMNDVSLIGLNAGSRDTIMVIHNGATAWEKLLLPTDSLDGKELTIKDLVLWGDSTVYALVSNDSVYSDYLFVTKNLGQSWDTLSTPDRILYNHINNNRPLAAFLDSIVLISNLSDGIYRSFNYGQDWDTLSLNDSSMSMMNFKSVGNLIMANCASANDNISSIARTSNFGTSWQFDTLKNVGQNGALHFDMFNSCYGWAFQYGPKLHVYDNIEIEISLSFNYNNNIITSNETDATSMQWYRVDSIVSGTTYYSAIDSAWNQSYKPDTNGSYFVQIFKKGKVDSSALISLYCVGTTSSTAKTLNLGSDTSVCGDITIDLSADFDNFTWFDGDDSGIRIISKSGKYAVQVNDTSGCAIDSINVTVNEYPEFGLKDQVSCGPIILDAGNYSSFNWNTGDTTQTIQVFDTSGNFGLVITNAAGCSIEDSVDVTSYPLPVSTLMDTTFCSGSTISAGSFDKYDWSTGDSTQNITITKSGTYYFTGIDTNGCSVSDSSIVTVLELPEVEIHDTSQCGGNITLIPSGYIGTYAWNTGSTDSSILIDSFGTYEIIVQVTDSNGCLNRDTAEVNLFSIPAIDLVDTTLCSGTELDPGNFETYDWSTGDTTSTIFVTQSGKYGLTTVDANGCSVTDTAQINVWSLPEVQIDDTAQCDGTIELIPAGYIGLYSWSTGSTDSSIIIDKPDNYLITVEVTDSNGCTSDRDTALVNLYEVQIIEFIDSIQCGGSITLDPGVFAINKWSTGDSTNNLVVTKSGTYSYYGIDSNGCTSFSDTIDIVIYDEPTIAIADTSQCDGAIDIIPTGSTGNYSWSTGSKDSAITISTPGTYKISVEVTDSNNCTSKTSTAQVELFAKPEVSIGDTTQCGGSIVLTPGGDPGKYTWNFSTSSATYTVNQFGDFTIYVEVLDGNGCLSDVDSAEVSLYQIPNVTLFDSTQCGGTIDLDAGSFTTYDWSTGDKTQVLTVDKSGTYTVNVTDSNGCTTSDKSNITIYDVPVIDVRDTTSCASVLLNAGNHVNYLWSTGSTQSTETYNTSGNYYVEVRNQFNCPTVDSFKVTVHSLPIFDIADTSICDKDTAFYSAISAVSYTWSSGGTNQNKFYTDGGKKWLQVTDANGCIYADTFTISVNSLPFVPVQDFKLCLGASETLDGGNYVDHLWSTGATTRMETFDQSGVFSLRITDTKGCSASKSFNVAFYPEVKIALGKDTAQCGGFYALDISAEATKIKSYTWSNGNNTLVFNVFNSGDLWINWRDSNSCDHSDSINIAIYDIPTAPVISKSGHTLFSDVSGIEWYRNDTLLVGENEDSLNAEILGTYKARLIDGNGCISTFSNTIKRTTGIAVLDGGSLNVYPNPTTDYVTIDISGLTSPLISIKVLNMLGVEIAVPVKDLGTDQIIDLSTLAKGNYIVLVTTENGRVSKVIMKH